MLPLRYTSVSNGDGDVYYEYHVPFPWSHLSAPYHLKCRNGTSSSVYSTVEMVTIYSDMEMMSKH